MSQLVYYDGLYLAEKQYPKPLSDREGGTAAEREGGGFCDAEEIFCDVFITIMNCIT